MPSLKKCSFFIPKSAFVNLIVAVTSWTKKTAPTYEEEKKRKLEDEKRRKFVRVRKW